MDGDMKNLFTEGFGRFFINLYKSCRYCLDVFSNGKKNAEPLDSGKFRIPFLDVLVETRLITNKSKKNCPNARQFLPLNLLSNLFRPAILQFVHHMV